MKSVSPTELRTNIYHLLDEVLRTGLPLEVRRGGRRLRIVPVEQPQKLAGLIPRPEVIVGDPEDLVELSWEGEVDLDLP